MLDGLPVLPESPQCMLSSYMASKLALHCRLLHEKLALT